MHQSKKCKQMKRELFFPKLDIDSFVIRGYADTGFSNSPDLKSQLAIVIVLVDKHDNGAVVLNEIQKE